MSKTESMNIAPTDEMKKFIASQSGSGTFYATPSEYVRDLICHERDLLELDLVPMAEGVRILPGDSREYSRQLQALPDSQRRPDGRN